MVVRLANTRIVCGAVITTATIFGGMARGGDEANDRIRLLENKIQQLESQTAMLRQQVDENWLTDERSGQIKGLVQEVLADAKTRGQFADGDLAAGYDKGFFIRTADNNYKLTINGWAQFRYTYGRYENKANGAGTAIDTDNRDNTSAFEVRDFRISFAGNVVTPKLTYKIEISANRGQDITYTDAFVAYKFNDVFNVRAGSFKAPFAKSTLTSDTALGLMSRPEVLLPFDAGYQLGASLYGDIIKDTLSYEVAITNGTSGDFSWDYTDGTEAPSIDNRPAFYARIAWAGSGTTKDFSDESDLRKDNSNFIWMLGAAVGYESHNVYNENVRLNGLGSHDSGTLTSGFPNPAWLELSDVYRATIDWSAKWRGWSFLTAAYFQQAQLARMDDASYQDTYNEYYRSTLFDSSGFQFSAYGQIGYFIIPQKLELLGRISTISSEGPTDSAQYYTIGANYYLAGHNARISTDLTWVPSESAISGDDGDPQRNLESFIYRFQIQISF